MLADKALPVVADKIALARQSKDKNRAIKFCKEAKKVLLKVDTASADSSTLAKLVAAYRDHAQVLDRLGLPDKAFKSRKRADQLLPPHQEPGTHPAFLMAPMAGMSLSTAASSASVLSVSSESSVNLQTTLSLLSGSTCPTSVRFSTPAVYFEEDICPPTIECSFPTPNAHLRDTRQLAACLALLQATDLTEEKLSPEAKRWLYATRANLDEKKRLETLSTRVVRAFMRDELKGAEIITEVVQLAFTLDTDSSRLLLRSFVDAVGNSIMLDVHSLEGLAHLIQGAAPGSINSDDLVQILGLLNTRLQRTHHKSVHRYQLAVAVSYVLDAMVDSDIEGVNRVNLHGPLSAYLHDLKSSKDPCLVFQAAYAYQALQHVPDNETRWQATIRRSGAVLRGIAGVASAVKNIDLNGLIAGLCDIHDGLKGTLEVAATLREAYSDVHDLVESGSELLKALQEGFSFDRKQSWYDILRVAGTLLQSGKLVSFKALVSNARCRHNVAFQWGIIQLLGKFAADSRIDAETRSGAVLFLGDLYQDKNVWAAKVQARQLILNTLIQLVSDDGSALQGGQVTLDELKHYGDESLQKVYHECCNAGRSSPSWNNIPPTDPIWHAKPEGILLKGVQKGPSMEDIQSALNTYYAPSLSILRVSGKTLDLETCYVNLAIVEAPTQREKEKQDLKEQAAVFHRIPSFEVVEGTNVQSSILMEQLFNKRKLRNGKEDIPKRILVQGRAGIGKTTLCKMLVHAHQTGLWRGRFDSVLWLPLRQLRASTSRSLEDLFLEKIFIGQALEQDRVELAQALAKCAQKGRVLFVLDGLDEIVTETESEEGNALRFFLRILLEQQHVVITSRPSGVDPKLLASIDLELETIGFSQQNVKDFLVKVLEPAAATTVQDFIQRTPLIQSLVNIPVQLDVICFSWDSLPKDGLPITMTRLYQLMVRKLWCKDAIRLKKTSPEGKPLSQKLIDQLMEMPEVIDDLMSTELQHLGYLAFKGLTNKHQIEFDQKALLCTFGELRKHGATILYPSELLEMMKQTSFFHTADADLDPSKNDSQQAWYFLHLTFQEYFAATWIAQHLQLKKPHLSAGSTDMEPTVAFVQEHKYNPQYEIVWWMVSGLLEGQA
ncbi:hypothetical protein BGX28_002237 [Mortierella sp. GBA30]|nr:hypothetical protein BGX28_002237 [Mortierella sp. GBA30]